MQSGLLEPEIRRNPQPGDAFVLWLPVFLGLGCGLYFIMPGEASPAILWGLFLATILGVIGTYHWREHAVWRYGAAFILLMLLGFSWTELRTHSVNTTLLRRNVFNGTVTGTIQSTERVGTGWRVTLTNARIENDKHSYILRLTMRQRDQHPLAGGQLKAQVGLMPPSPPLLPGMYDFQRHAYFHGISGYGYVTKVLTLTPPDQQAKISLLDRYRNFLADNVYSTLRQPEAGITTALLNGQRGGIANRTTQSLQQSGLQHIISISGLHVGLLAGIVFYIVRLLLALSMRLALLWSIKKIAAACAFIAIILYMMVVGNDPATLRSVIMAGVALFAIMVDREAINLRVVAIAALAILLYRPESVVDIGFQLSFAAVTALVAFYQFTNIFWQAKIWQDLFLLKLSRPILLSVVTSVIATLATAPLVFLHFQQVPALSMLANALATPVVAFIIMPGTFLAYLLTPFGVIGDWAILYMGWGVTLILDISSWISSLPMAVWRIPAIPASPVFLIMLGLFLAIVLRKRWRLTALAPAFCGAIILITYQPADIFLASNRVFLLPDRANNALYTEGYLDGFSKNLFLHYTGMARTVPINCADEVCLARDRVALIRTVPALTQACRHKVPVLITRYYLDERCPDTRILDRHVLNKRGGIALWLDNLHYNTVFTSSSRKPWQNQAWSDRGKQDWHFRTRRHKISYSSQ